MRGHIKRKNNSWYIVFDQGKDPLTNKRRQKWIKVDKWLGRKATKKDAEKLLVEMLQKQNAGDYVEPTNITLGQYLVSWLSNYAKPNLTPQTYNSYKVIVANHLIPKIGNIQLTKLQPIHIQNYYTSALQNGRCDGKGGLSTRTVRFHHSVLREALQHALKLQMINRNVADAVNKPRKKQFHPNVPGEKAIAQLMACAVKDDVMRIPVSIAIGTGLRRGEILGLRWKDVDFKAGTLTVSQALEVTENGLNFSTPKTERSRRVVELPQDLTRELKLHKNLQAEQKIGMGANYNDNDLVVCLPNGSPCNPSTFSYWFRNFLKKFGLPHMRFHDLRHAHATLLLKLGIHPKVVSERLGHSTINLTLDTYSHVWPNLQKEAASKLNDVLFKGQTPKE